MQTHIFHPLCLRLSNTREYVIDRLGENYVEKIKSRRILVRNKCNWNGRNYINTGYFDWVSCFVPHKDTKHCE